MPGKVLLISVNRCEVPCAVFPLGLAYVDSALQQAGHMTRWFDCQADQTPLAKVLGEFQPDFVGISLRNIDDVVIRKRETFYNGLDELCRDIRHYVSAPIILGGSGFSIFPRELIELSGADFGIQGQGEQSLLALLAALENKTSLSAIPGLVFRANGKIILNGCLPNGMEASSRLPERPQALVDFYLRKSGMLNIQTQRGCAFHCCYCTYPLIEGRHCHHRPPEDVADEFAQLERLGARYVFIVDSVFNSSPDHAAAVCEALVRRSLKLRWGCFLRPKRLDAELMHLMASAGLSHIEFGTDSFCDEVLDAYGKRFSFDDIHQSSELARRERVDYCHFLICGGPGETRATLQTSFENSLRLPGAIILALVGMRVYPGTPLFDRICQEQSSTARDLLTPQYYLAPTLTEEEVFAQLRKFSQLAPSWVVGDPPANYLQAVDRLRAKGIIGPLWSYFALMQRWASGMPTNLTNAHES